MNKASFLIIGGTEKAGTTSMYQYLAAHPQVRASRRKETDYFRSAPPHAISDYLTLFNDGATTKAMYMEASPGYLSESEIAAPAMSALIPDSKLLFILRNPIERLLSGFEFHKSRFHIPESMTFDNYIDLCMRFERNEISQEQTGLKLWHLKVPDAGKYGRHLADFMTRFPCGQIKVTALEDLQKDPFAYVTDVCQWAGLDASFFNDFEFFRANVTFKPRRRWLQKVGLAVNSTFEPVFNRYPMLKHCLLTAYKRVNGAQVEKPAMSPRTREILREYYAGDLRLLTDLLGDGGVMVARWAK